MLKHTNTKARYLLQSIKVKGSTLILTEDLNVITIIKVIRGALKLLFKLTFNGVSLPFKIGNYSVYIVIADFKEPKLTLLDLSTLN